MIGYFLQEKGGKYSSSPKKSQERSKYLPVNPICLDNSKLINTRNFVHLLTQPWSKLITVLKLY